MVPGPEGKAPIILPGIIQPGPWFHHILALTVNFKWQKGGFHHRKAKDHTKRDKLKEEEDSLGVPGLFGPSSDKLGN